MTRSAEQRLIEQAVKGDRDAADKLIRAHQGSLYAYLLRLSGKPDMAEDIVQDAFVRVLTHLERFDPKYRFSTWLFTIAKRLYVNANQKCKPHYDTDIVDSWKGADESPSRPAEVQEVRENARSAIGDALQTLSEQQREIVLLFHQQSWPIALIAEHMSMPEGTIKSHLHRGRQRMRKHIERVNETVRDAAEAWS